MRPWMLVGLLALVTGCSTTATSPGLTAATLSGSVVSAASSSSSPSSSGSPLAASAPAAGITVSVPGAKATATIDVNGNFTLTGVPPGDNVTVRFSGGGLNVQVTVGLVGRGETITATFVREGNQVTLDCVRRKVSDREELEGRIDGLPPATPAGTFTIAGQSVQTDANTKFFRGDAAATFADLELGMRVHVKGTPNASGVLASLVKIQNPNSDLAVHLEGAIAELSGTAAAFQFTVNGKLVKGDATTAFIEGASFASLANGARVGVKGQMRDGFIFATKIVVQ